jgi:hypothetical protein
MTSYSRLNRRRYGKYLGPLVGTRSGVSILKFVAKQKFCENDDIKAVDSLHSDLHNSLTIISFIVACESRPGF